MPSPMNGNRRSTCTLTLICAFVVSMALAAAGVIFLAFPDTARRFLYPCISQMEHHSAPSLASQAFPVVLEGDAIRLAGACFLSVAMSSMGLLGPLLPCCHYEREREGNDAGEHLGKHVLLRTSLFIHASMGLCLVGVGTVNFGFSEDAHNYDGRYHCSSLKDQTIFWMGVGVTCLTFSCLLASFCPESGIFGSNDNFDDTSRYGGCCRRKSWQTRLISPENSEPLLPSEVGQECRSGGEGSDIYSDITMGEEGYFEGQVPGQGGWLSGKRPSCSAANGVLPYRS